MSTRGPQFLLALMIPLLAFVCGRPPAPLIHNAMDRQIELSVKYRSGQSFQEKFPPDATISAPVEGTAVDEIQVRSGDQVLYTLKRDDLERLRSAIDPNARVKWEIREDGVTATVATN